MRPFGELERRREFDWVSLSQSHRVMALLDGLSRRKIDHYVPRCRLLRFLIVSYLNEPP